MRRGGYTVVLGHVNEDRTAFGISSGTAMTYPSVEMLLRLADPMKSVEWCRTATALPRGSYMVIELDGISSDGKRTMKFLKITRN